MPITSGIIKLCLLESEKSNHRFKIGAVVFKGNRILSSGHNEIRSSNIPSKHKLYNNSVHAEQAALLGTDWNKLKGCSILVMRCSKTKGNLSNAKPLAPAPILRNSLEYFLTICALPMTDKKVKRSKYFFIKFV